MHEGETQVEDPNWLLKWVVTLIVIFIPILQLVKNTAFRYLEEVHSDLDTWSRTDSMPSPASDNNNNNNNSLCAGCGKPGNKQCSRCKSVKYCSSKCQEAHWKSGHKSQCKKATSLCVSGPASRPFSGIALVPTSGSCTSPIKKLRDVLFPYEEFVELYNWNNTGFPPCGLLNCGNSCFANVVLQCLTYTRPLFAYLLEKGHRQECRRNEWCFLCVFQEHVERASKSSQAFSPMSILSHLPSLGGNLGYGKQEDAHEFMRFAIDMMQSVCLDEFGGEKAVSPSTQETTLIQHIFGGHLRSQVYCSRCNKVSNQLENMMDLAVEIDGEVVSLEECLDQFTKKEWLHGDNMYKCDGCNDYVKAWKQLTIKRAPNILTIALKRFQSGRFGKLNKRVTFCETLDLSPYMSEDGDGSDLYKLYAVVVHVDMLNASFFGHYICYTKDFCGNWYRIDDCKVARVELEEVLSQGAYMLLYSRISVRPSCLTSAQPSKEQQSVADFSSCIEEKKEGPCPSDMRAEHNSASQEIVMTAASNSASDIHPLTGKVSDNINASETCFSAGMEVSGCQEDPVVAFASETLDRGLDNINAVEPSGSTVVSMEVSDCNGDLCAGVTSKSGDAMEDLNDEEAGSLKFDPTVMTANGDVDSLLSEATITRTHKLKRNLSFRVLAAENGVKRAEVGNGY